MRLAAILATLAMLLLNPSLSRAVEPTSLRCEYLDNPLCVEADGAPRLSWIPDASGRIGAAQTAYRIIVSSSPDLLDQGIADIWDSGKVKSEATAHIPCGGNPTPPFASRFWRVMLWDEADRPGPWSPTARWTAAPATPADWHGAQWIALKPLEQWQTEWAAHKNREIPLMADSGPIRSYAGLNLWQIIDSIPTPYDAAPLMRREFRVPDSIISATLYICGLGFFEASINGAPVSRDVLNPAWTAFDSCALYSTYDVTPLLHPGHTNAIGVTLGRGQLNPICNDAWGLWKTRWISEPRLIAMLRMQSADGNVQWLVTDPSWRVTQGPTVFDDTRLGEIYDARRELPGWDSPGFDDSSWDAASPLPLPLSPLRPQLLPPVRPHQPIAPVRRLDRPGNIAIFDIGENIAGWARVNVAGPRGARVLVEYCELPSDTILVPNLHPARLAMSASLPDPHAAAFHDATTEVRQQNAYILRGDSSESFQCRFSYKGFRFIRVTADPGVAIIAADGIPVHSDLTPVGSFSCSDPTINRLQEMARRTLLNNLVGIPTDCPHREKQGWTADGYFTSAAAMYNFDMSQFYLKWMRDLAATQVPSGALCTVAPSVGYDEGVSISWPVALTVVPGELYDFYGEHRLLAELYPAMLRFASHARSHELPDAPEMVSEVLGDWVSPADSILPTLKGSSILAPPEGVNTYGASSYYALLRDLCRFARITGNDADSTLLLPWARRIRSTFNDRFLHPAEAAYSGHIPTPYRLAPNAVALMEGLVPDTLSMAVGNRLRAALAADGFKARTGFLGTRALMKWLPLHDPEAAWALATQPEYPGWGYMVAQGATTMWEDWAACASVDHLPYALISEYFFRHLAGITLSHSPSDKATAAPAARPELLIAPSFVKALSHASASYRSLYGLISVDWRRQGSDILLSLSIPPNLPASLALNPSDPSARITLPSGAYTLRLSPAPDGSFKTALTAL